MQVFEMFAYVTLEDDPRGAPPAHPGTGWRERYSARQRIGGLVLAYARAAPQVQLMRLWGCQEAPLYPGARQNSYCGSFPWLVSDSHTP